MYNEAAILGVLHELKSSCVNLSIDDFSTGYSSFSYLQRLLNDKSKNQSFIQDCYNNDEEVVIVSTIVELGKSSELSLIAEGV